MASASDDSDSPSALEGALAKPADDVLQGSADLLSVQLRQTKSSLESLTTAYGVINAQMQEVNARLKGYGEFRKLSAEQSARLSKHTETLDAFDASLDECEKVATGLEANVIQLGKALSSVLRVSV